MDDSIFNSVFWLAFTSSMVGLIFGLAKVIQKSKCKKCSFCGIYIERDTEAEEKLDEIEMNRNQQRDTP